MGIYECTVTSSSS